MTTPLRVAVVHYHLQRGGVTRVIQQAVRSIAPEQAQFVVLSGAPSSEPFPQVARLATVPGLAYADVRTAPSPRQLTADLRETARRNLDGHAPDLWHVHNHSLGKNPALPAAVNELAACGERLVLQPHDFAEDGRAEIYRNLLGTANGDSNALGTLLYPQAAHVHYALLNHRDRTFLQAAGAAPERLHALPNPVALEAPPGGVGDSVGEGEIGDLVLYPTRAIRRKNLGELLLWAAQRRPGVRFATTLAPQNPAEQARYSRWVGFSNGLQLPVEFELGARHQGLFVELLAQASCLLTTSVTEGFGLAFLEPWLIPRPLCGRDLPEVTTDFKAAGVRLDALYSRVGVPLEWLGVDVVRDAYSTALHHYLRSYGRVSSAADLDRALVAAIDGGRIDFGCLNEPLQERVIERVAGDSAASTELAPTWPAIGSRDDEAHNRTVVNDVYNLAHYGRRLLAIYEHCCASPTEPLAALDGTALLDQFLAPERFTLLRAP